MNNLQKFDHDGISVEVINLDGRSLFNATQIGDGLYISPSGVRTALIEMEEGTDYVLVTNSMIENCPDVCLTDIRKLNNRGESFLTESGIYEMMIQSRRPEAKSFRRWITREVLPSIRETGAYGTPQQKRLPVNYPEALRELAASEEERMLLQERTEHQTKQLAKATDVMAGQAADMQVYDRIMRPKDLISLWDAAKLIDHPIHGPQKIFKLLVKLDMIYKTNVKSVPYKPKQKHRRHLKLVRSRYKRGEVYEPYLRVDIRLCGINYVVKRIIEESGGWDGLKGREQLAREFCQKLDQPVGNTGGLFEQTVDDNE